MAYQLTMTCDRCSLQDITDPVGTHSLPLRTDILAPEGWDQTEDELLCGKCRRQPSVGSSGYYAAQADGDAS